MGLEGMCVEEQENGTQKERRKLAGQWHSWDSLIRFLDPEQPHKKFWCSWWASPLQ